MAPPALVLYVNHVSQVSGAEESVLALMTHLDRTLFVPLLACPPGALAARAKEAGIEWVSLPLIRFHRTHNPLLISRYAVSWFLGRAQLRRIVRLRRPRIIHANSPTAQLYVGAVADRARVPSVWHSRDLRPLPLTALTICRGADRIIAISEAVADLLAQQGLTRPRVTRIYNGIDPVAWRARVTSRDVRAAFNLSARDRILLMAAQFVPWKRHEDAIHMMPAVLKKQPDACLMLAGADIFGDNTGLVPQLQALAKSLGVEKRVIFAGRRDDIPDIIAAAELVLIPSDAEPFGRVAMEAMALGKPVVGTRAGGLPEIVRDGETGLLVVPRVPESLASACLRVLENRSFAQGLGEAGLHRVATQFHIDGVAQEVQALYRSMMHPPLRWVRT